MDTEPSPISENDIQVQPVDTKSENVKKEPTKFQAGLRKILINLLVLLVVFVAGYLTQYFTVYKPTVATLEQTQADLEDARAELTDLQEEFGQALNQIESMRPAHEHASLQAVIIDILTAQIALMNGDSSVAELALDQTVSRLEGVLEAIEKYDQVMAETLPQRLSLIQANIDSDPQTAITDCGLLITDLQEADQALYGD